MTTLDSEFTSKDTFQPEAVRSDAGSEHAIDTSEHDATKRQDRGVTDEVNEIDTEYPSFLPLLLITIALCLAVFCVSLGMLKLPLDSRTGTLMQTMRIRQYYYCHCYPEKYVGIHKTILVSRAVPS